VDEIWTVSHKMRINAMDVMDVVDDGDEEQ
jgi:hypothetical protein